MVFGGYGTADDETKWEGEFRDELMRIRGGECAHRVVMKPTTAGEFRIKNVKRKSSDTVHVVQATYAEATEQRYLARCLEDSGHEQG